MNQSFKLHILLTITKPHQQEIIVIVKHRICVNLFQIFTNAIRFRVIYILFQEKERNRKFQTFGMDHRIEHNGCNY